MSVIPLIIDGAKPTIVDTKEKFESFGGLNGDVILIQNLDRGQLISKNDTNVSYDLRVGNEYKDHRDQGKKDITEDGIKLLPGSAVIIETMEYVYFHKMAFGHIVPKVSLLQSGISNTSSKVDPGYFGNLLITVFNLGKRTITLKKGDKFCSLYILKVLEGARPYDKPPKRLEGKAKTGVWTQMKDFIEANSVVVMVLEAIAAIIAVILAIFK